nr:uncharacterized protein LOC112285443 isoform X2 [Physcomitrium patens]|eukprot:XP_024382050.1 uncharacterized protein LOC112285443 isoform X2 [Physcomitrella patens]
MGSSSSSSSSSSSTSSLSSACFFTTARHTRCLQGELAIEQRRIFVALCIASYGDSASFNLDFDSVLWASDVGVAIGSAGDDVEITCNSSLEAGPLLEEFWDNVRRYGFYFFTVVSGGLYSLTKPLLDLLKDPSTQILVAIAVFGTLYLVYLTVSTMLGLNDFSYEYAQ